MLEPKERIPNRFSGKREIKRKEDENESAHKFWWNNFIGTNFKFPLLWFLDYEQSSTNGPLLLIPYPLQSEQ